MRPPEAAQVHTVTTPHAIAAKNLFKVTLVYGIGMMYVLSLFGGLNLLATQDLQQALGVTGRIVRDGFVYLLAPIVLVALADTF